MRSCTDASHLQNYRNSWVSSSEYFCLEGLSSLAGSGNWNLLFSHGAEITQSATLDILISPAFIAERLLNECRTWLGRSQHRVCSLLATRDNDICRCKANSDLVGRITEPGPMRGIFQDQGQSFSNMFCNWNDHDDIGKECRPQSLWLGILATFVSI